MFQNHCITILIFYIIAKEQMTYHAFNTLNPEAKEGIYISSFMVSSNQMYIMRIFNLILKQQQI